MQTAQAFGKLRHARIRSARSFSRSRVAQRDDGWSRHSREIRLIWRFGGISAASFMSAQNLLFCAAKERASRATDRDVHTRLTPGLLACGRVAAFCEPRVEVPVATCS